MQQFLQRIVDNNPETKNYHTDGFKEYDVFFNHIKENQDIKHTTTKNQTTQVESFNSVLRNYVPSLTRRTKVVNRSNTMLYKITYAVCALYNRKIKSFNDFLNKIIKVIFDKNNLKYLKPMNNFYMI